MKHVSQSLFIVAATALIYFLGFQLNFRLFTELESSFGVNWIFIPSGIRLAAVLLAGWLGALGIVLGSFIIVLVNTDVPLSIFSIGTALISGLSPLFARRVAITYLRLDPELSNIKTTGLLGLASLFAVISASAHQLWFSVFERNSDLLQDTFIMAFGDLAGTLIVLFSLELVIMALRKNGPRS